MLYYCCMDNVDQQNYVIKIETLQGLPGGLVGKKNILFSNIEMLYEFNKGYDGVTIVTNHLVFYHYSVFLPKLQKIKQCPIKLGQVFIDYVSY